MLAPILNNVKKLVDRLTATRAGYLDKLNITGNVADGNDWTAARAAKIDTIDSRMPASGTIPNTTEVPSATDYTAARAAKLDNIIPIPQIKRETGVVTSLAISMYSGITDTQYAYFRAPYSCIGSFTNFGLLINNDGDFGFRMTTGIPTSTLADVINISGSGWLLGICMWNACPTGSSYDATNTRLNCTLDGTQIFNTGVVTLGFQKAFVPVGFAGGVYDGTNVGVAPFPNCVTPIRFESSLNVKHRSDSTYVRTSVVYLLD